MPVALTFAPRRSLTLRRLWMTRSYAVALVFFEGRLILGVTGSGPPASRSSRRSFARVRSRDAAIPDANNKAAERT